MICFKHFTNIVNRKILPFRGFEIFDKYKNYLTKLDKTFHLHLNQQPDPFSVFSSRLSAFELMLLHLLDLVLFFGFINFNKEKNYKTISIILVTKIILPCCIQIIKRRNFGFIFLCDQILIRVSVFH